MSSQRRHKLHGHMRCGNGCPQPIDGRSSQQNVVKGVDTDYQVSDFDILARFSLVEGGIKFDIPSGAHSFTWEANHMIVILIYLLLNYPYLFERLPVENVYWTPLVHQRLHNGEFVNVDWYHHKVVLWRVNTLKIFAGEGDGWHPRSKQNDVHLMHCPQVFLPDVVGATSPSNPQQSCWWPLGLPFFHPFLEGPPFSTDVRVDGHLLVLPEECGLSVLSALPSVETISHLGPLVQTGGDARLG